MNYVDHLRAQRGSFASAWLSFVTAYRPGDQEVYAFFEGADDVSFFMPHLRQRAPRIGPARSFTCKGKRVVLRLVQAARRKLDRKNRALFFVDKDVDDIVSGESAPTDPYVFRTECYSIENYIASEEAALLVWAELFQLPETCPSKAVAIETFRRIHESGLRRLALIMAWVIDHRVHGRKPNLNNMNLGRILSFRPNGTVRLRRRALSELDRSCGVTSARCWRSVLFRLRTLKTMPPKTYVRGKYELWLFVRALEHIVAVARTTGRHSTCSSYINTANAVSIIAPRLPAPSTLSAFLDRLEMLDG